ncbi:MAG: HEAT repeat domain-containing protein [bacterium]|nr:HEAT repeat domain-containing protein [bacterium]
MHTDDIVARLKKGNEEEKSGILSQISQTDDISLIAPLVVVLENESSRAVKERLLLLLNRLLPLTRYRTGEVERMMRSPDPFVRNGIVEIIRRSDIPIIRFLEQLGEDEDKDVRKFVIDALSREKSEKACRIIRNRLDDSDINIVYTAVEHLGNFKDVNAAGKIESILLSSTHFMVTCSALEALAKIGVSPSKDIIIAKYQDSQTDPLLVFSFLRYLGTFGNAGTFDFLANLLETRPGTYDKEVVDSLLTIVRIGNLDSLPGTLRETLTTLSNLTRNGLIRYSILKLLVHTGGSTKQQLPQIHAMLEDPEDMARLCAVELLGEFGGRDDIQRLEVLAEQTEGDELLEAIGDSVMKIEERTDDE